MIKKALWMMLCCLLSGCSKDTRQTEVLTPVCIKPYHDYRYLTCNTIEFKIDGKSFTIPKGFETDLASIPRIAWPVISPAHSSLIRPAIIHDWFYRMTCDFNRKETDEIFYHMLVNDGVPSYKARLMYYAVRAFGWQFYTEEVC